MVGKKCRRHVRLSAVDVNKSGRLFIASNLKFVEKVVIAPYDNLICPSDGQSFRKCLTSIYKSK